MQFNETKLLLLAIKIIHKSYFSGYASLDVEFFKPQGMRNETKARIMTIRVYAVDILLNLPLIL